MLHVAVCDRVGRIYRNENARAAGRSGRLFSELLDSDVIPLPEGSSLMRLPDRAAVGIEPKTGEFVRAEPGDAVAALLPQGYTRTFLPAYSGRAESPRLPLFGYSAVAFRDEELVVAAIRTDERDTWNPIHYNLPELAGLIEAALAEHPANRILRQLAVCASNYQCFTAQNIFYRRWEGGVPVSPKCNSNCIGCISLQPSECCPSPQQRIDFVPTVDEIVEVALPHLEQGEEAIISFGQGCEGEPTLQHETIAEAVRAIRSRTDKGTINANTNAGNTEAIRNISDSGIDSLRVSLASARPEYYDRYHMPKGFGLPDVEQSIRLARERGVYVSLNYLVFPGFSDLEPEVEALADLIERTGVQMIQVRNLNIDPEVFADLMLQPADDRDDGPEPVGVSAMIDHIRDCSPEIVIGSFSLPVRNSRG
ncbi:MAG: radical SAM protein [Firmicutes bacterium]|nr:radical SAM protein [Bacillota bacterium]